MLPRGCRFSLPPWNEVIIARQPKRKLKESLNILFSRKRKKQCRLKSGGTVPIDMMFPPARRKRLVLSNLQSFEKPPQGSFPIYPAFPLAFGKVIDLAYCSTAIFALQERFSNFCDIFFATYAFSPRPLRQTVPIPCPAALASRGFRWYTMSRS